MGDHASDKATVARFLTEIADAEPAEIRSVLERFCHPDVVWRVFHPFGELQGVDAAAESFWAPLKAAFPDHEHRLGFVVGGTWEERSWVATLGHVMGNLVAPWLGVPPTHGLAFLRFAFNARVRDGKIEQGYVLFDAIDLMRQAGFYPFRKMPGSPEQWPMPPLSRGAGLASYDGGQGAASLQIVREMQMGLGKGADLMDLSKARGRHSPHWHRNMNWYGPAGIGSSRGQRGFLDYHGALFIQAFPDREGIAREPEGPDPRPGHYIRAGDGRFAVTAGWPSLYGTHLGGGWLGLAPSGRRVEMRVADWYRIDDDDRIIDNWVLIDIPHILHQAGLDLFEDLRFSADPTLARWPL